jgi:hypothetical protein
VAENAPPADLTAGVKTWAVVQVLESVWASARRRHPEIPDAVVVIASGSERGQLAKYGHYAQLRWQTAGGQLPEVLVAGEGLARGPEPVLATLLHEAAHGLADVRGIQDTSRQGRYHNRRYLALAEQLGLQVAQAPVIGWSVTTLRPETREAYADELAVLAPVLTMHRAPELPGRRGGGSRYLLAACSCGRKVRVVRRTFDAGPIVCGLCGHPFQLDDQDAGE